MSLPNNLPAIRPVLKETTMKNFFRARITPLIFFIFSLSVQAAEEYGQELNFAMNQLKDLKQRKADILENLKKDENHFCTDFCSDKSGLKDAVAFYKSLREEVVNCFKQIDNLRKEFWENACEKDVFLQAVSKIVKLFLDKDLNVDCLAKLDFNDDLTAKFNKIKTDIQNSERCTRLSRIIKHINAFETESVAIRDEILQTEKKIFELFCRQEDLERYKIASEQNDAWTELLKSDECSNIMKQKFGKFRWQEQVCRVNIHINEWDGWLQIISNHHKEIKKDSYKKNFIKVFSFLGLGGIVYFVWKKYSEYKNKKRKSEEERKPKSKKDKKPKTKHNQKVAEDIFELTK